jgi:hypothetical protein
VTLLALGGALAQVQGIRSAGQAGVVGQEPGQRQPFLVVNTVSATAITVDMDDMVVVIGASRVWLRPRRLGLPRLQQR